MPRTRVYGELNAQNLANEVRKQGGRSVKIRNVIGEEGRHREWYLVTWNRPEPFNIHHHLWWITAIVIAYALWRING